VPYLSASEVAFYEGALYQVYVPLRLPLPYGDSEKGIVRTQRTLRIGTSQFDDQKE